MFFAQDYKQEFQEIKLGESIFYDPTIYVNITSNIFLEMPQKIVKIGLL